MERYPSRFIDHSAIPPSPGTLDHDADTAPLVAAEDLALSSGKHDDIELLPRGVSDAEEGAAPVSRDEPRLNPKVSHHPIDRSYYAYLIVFCSFVVHFFILGAPYAMGVFQIVYETAFDVDHFQASWIGTISAGLFNLTGLVAGGLADRLGYQRVVRGGILTVAVGYILASFSTQLWQLYLTQGAMVGFGSAFAYYPAVSAVSQWFDKHRAFATGIAVSGAGIGGFVFSPMIRYLVDVVGWQWSLRVIAILTFVILGIVSLFMHQRVFARRGKVINLDLLRTRAFCFMCLGSVVGFFGYWTPFYYLPSYIVSYGFSSSFGALVLGILNGASAVGRIVLGLIADRIGRVNMLVSCWFVASLMVLVWLFCTAAWSLIIFAILFGFSVGGFMSITPVVAADLMGADRLASVMGMLYFGNTFGNVFGPAIAGYLFDIAAPSFALGILFSFAMLFIGAISVGQVWLVQKSSRAAAFWDSVSARLWCTPDKAAELVDESD